MTLKTLRFDYFETWVRKIDKNSNSATDRRLDISNLLDKALRIQRQDTLRDFRSEKARIQKIELRSDGCYEIEFLRLRESMPPGIANDSGNYEIIRLGNDEYIGEFTAALYDPAK